MKQSKKIQSLYSSENGARALKPFKISEEGAQEWQFTKQQQKAYRALVKATERCKNVGLCLLAQQHELIAIPAVIYMNHMTGIESRRKVECPKISGARIADSGADDTEYILDQYIL